MSENIADETSTSQFSLLDHGKSMTSITGVKIEEKNLIIVGDKASGKSTIFNNMLQSSSSKDSYNPTSGISTLR